MIGWEHPATAERYERYCRRYARYRRANQELVREAALTDGLRVLDVGAGTGRTASAALPHLGRDGSVLCVEPSRAMRAAGVRRLRDARVAWRADLPLGPRRTNGTRSRAALASAAGDPVQTAAHAHLTPEAEAFDRVLCGAAIWQLTPLEAWIPRLAGLLRAGGALAFDMPALYLGEPDEPGGGRDPLLLDLQLRLASLPADSFEETAPAASWGYDFAGIEKLLRAAGLETRAWTFRVRITQTAYARWLTIPVLTNHLLGGDDAAERDRRIERALASVDRDSFKWEHWRGWTAWKR